MTTPTQDLMACAIDTVESRRGVYGDPAEFFTALARRWSVTLGVPITPARAVLCMIDLKQQRLSASPFHADSIIDLVGYAGILVEVSKMETTNDAA